MRELIVDLFAGGGGASTAIFNATGRHPDVAVNHNADAIGVHAANHPQTKHYICDVREVDPVEACTIDGVLQPVGLLWMSPDCTHFSKARGGKPVEKGIRSLADVGLIWAEKVRPRLIHLENVEEFQGWGPVLENGQPCPERKGLDFRRWVKRLKDLGYAVEWRELVAADYGAPTTRKRLFLIARRDGERIRWPEPTHASRETIGKGDLFGRGLKPWRAAAEVIDWSIPAPSVFDRKKPLADKTMARIAKGIRRFVIEAPAPFIVPITHTGPGRVHDLAEPMRTITSANRGEFSLVAPHMTKFRSGSVGHDMADPVHTITANGFEKRPGGAVPLGVASAFLVPRYGENVGQEPRALDAAEPYPTVVPGGNGGDLAAVFLQKMNQNGIGASPDEPLVTVMAGAPRHYEVAAYLEQANTRDVGADATAPARTVTGKGHKGVVAAYLGRQFGSTVSGRDLDEPHPAVMSDGGGGKSQIIAASLDAYYATGVPASAEEPLRTVTAEDRHAITAAYMEQANTGVLGHPVEDPVSTILGAGCHQRLVELRLAAVEQHAGRRRRQVLEFLWANFGEPTESEWAAPTATPGARLKFGIVRVGELLWQIVDIGMRMLVPRELFNAQGFPPDYIIDRAADGRPITKTAQTSQAGNSVSPPPAEATLRANLTWMDLPERLAA